MSIECSVNVDCRQQSRALYGEEIEPLRADELQRVLKQEGDKLFGPFSGEIRAARRIRFQVAPALLGVPFDALIFDGKPLFVQKPILYSFGPDVGFPATVPKRSWAGLLASDQTADPQRAVFSISNVFLNSKKLDIAEVHPTELSEAHKLDFVAISAHGHVRPDDDDYIELKQGEKLTPSVIGALKPALVYFDSCNLGVSVHFLEALKQSGITYVLAPILSNEAGNSSTETIDAVFHELGRGANPVAALFRARKKLYEHYHEQKLELLLWKAFPFRVYALN
jgi:hypothetical protein